jgi:hypothetical protein
MGKPRKKSTRAGGSPIEAVRHKDKRKNIPTEELRDFVREEEHEPKKILYPRDPDLDPQLVWKGEDEQDQRPLEVPAVPIYTQEKIHPQAIIEDFRRNHPQKTQKDTDSESALCSSVKSADQLLLCNRSRGQSPTLERLPSRQYESKGACASLLSHVCPTYCFTGPYLSYVAGWSISVMPATVSEMPRTSAGLAASWKKSNPPIAAMAACEAVSTLARTTLVI